MKANLEASRDSLTISTDPSLLDLDTICSFLARSYWAKARPRERIEASFRNSFVFGVYDGRRQIGMARLVTDFVTFAWLCDVFVDEAYRGRGIGKWLMDTIVGHPQLQGLKRILLATDDAQELYSQYGFTPIANPEGWMERFAEELRDA
jgi:GNAT superfamily N-acetyltransferase